MQPVPSVFDQADICSRVLRARESVKFLVDFGLVSSIDGEDLQKKIDKKEKDNFVYISKPFRVFDSEKSYLLGLMKAKARLFLKNQEEAACDI